MKKLLAGAVLVSLLGGCAVVPVGPPGAVYVAPRAFVPAPVVVVRPWYQRRWYGY
jgi:hypothetical protein